MPANPAERLLLLVAAGLFALAVLLMLLPWGGDPGPGRFPLVATVPPTDNAAGRDVAADSAVALARPLFAQNRRPPDIAASGPAELPRLAGVIVGGGTPPKAIFAATGDDKPPVLGIGQSIAGHTLRAITPNGVTLDNGTVLHPTFATGADGAAPAAPPAGLPTMFTTAPHMPGMPLPFGGTRPGIRPPN
ncbi:hypothetical protein FHR90_002204 [Endobacter medicaginis]|uniref:Uncharacterized protein n=1 Tax=Endobacter medicaginis TaxID=1181271 RepID=A0A839V107_9PROT|nr:hypothetical protein [Endobacter medicaginis]MBB3174363.1 hypothetical protein [Endobacter medicaginis]MCX5477187.1 hypothetical protein [Endobacter medicaginis]